MPDNEKSPEMKELLNDFANKVFGRDRSNTIAAGNCVTCGGEAKGFKDAISIKEYKISGMCQKCQDMTFG